MRARNPWYRLDRHDEGTPEPTPDPAPEPSPTPEPTPAGPDPSEPVDVTALPPNVRKLIADLRKESGGHRQKATAAEQAAAAAQQQRDAILKAAGLNPDGSEASDPEAAVNQLTEQLGEYHDTLWKLSVDATVRAAASRLGANAEMLLDSNAFFSTLDEHVDDDPRDPEFARLVETRVEEAMLRDPERYKAATATPAGPPAPRPDRSQGRGASNDTPNFRTMPRAEVDAELAKFGFRQRS